MDFLLNSKVTKKLTVQNKNSWKPNCRSTAWICFLVLLISANMFFLQMMNEKCEKYYHEIVKLEKIVHEMRDESHNLTKSVIDLSRSNRSMDNSNHKLCGLKNNASKRLKRSDEKTSQWDQIRSRDTVAVQFSGSKPFGFSAIPSKGILGPWAESANDYSILKEFGAKLNDGNSTLEVGEDGLYLIYAQLTYLSFNSSNSYSIHVTPNADKAHAQAITTCSSFGKIEIGEISCYTSVTKQLNVGDVVYIQQAQPYREIVFSKAYTYFGLIFLS